MKPLMQKELSSFISRFGNFIDAEVRSADVISPTTIKVIIACQDSARGFDWLSINLEFSNIANASLVENSKLSFMDMSDGLDITYKESSFLFTIKNATMFIESSSIKYEEGLF